MIPFALFTRTVLDSGIVRVEFNNVQWMDNGDGTWSYLIPRAVHKSGIYPKTILVNREDKIVYGVNIEYTANDNIKLTSTIPYSSFTCYFMGDNTETPPAPSSNSYGLYATPTYLFYRKPSGEWVYSTQSAPSDFMTLNDNAPIGDYNFVGVFQPNRGVVKTIVTSTGDFYWAIGETTVYSQVSFPHPVVRVASCSWSQTNMDLMLVLLSDGSIYYNGVDAGFAPVIANSGAAWLPFTTPEPMVDLSCNGGSLTCVGVSGSIYGRGYPHHNQFPNAVQTGLLYKLPLLNSVGGGSASIGFGYRCFWQRKDKKWQQTGNGATPTGIVSPLETLTIDHSYITGYVHVRFGWSAGMFMIENENTAYTYNTWSGILPVFTPVTEKAYAVAGALSDFEPSTSTVKLYVLHDNEIKRYMIDANNQIVPNLTIPLPV